MAPAEQTTETGSHTDVPTPRTVIPGGGGGGEGGGGREEEGGRRGGGGNLYVVLFGRFGLFRTNSKVINSKVKTFFECLVLFFSVFRFCGIWFSIVLVLSF